MSDLDTTPAPPPADTPDYVIVATPPAMASTRHPATKETLNPTLETLREAHRVLHARLDVWKRLACGELHLVGVEIYTHHGVWEWLVNPFRAGLLVMGTRVGAPSAEGDTPPHHRPGRSRMSYLVRLYDRATCADRQVGPGLSLGEALFAAYVLLPVAPHSRGMVRTGSVQELSLALLLRLADGGINVIGHPDPVIVGRAIDDERARLEQATERLAYAVAHAETCLALASAHAGLARPPVGRLTTRTTATPGVGWRAHLCDDRGPVITTDPSATERRAVELLTRTLAHLWPERRVEVPS